MSNYSAVNTALDEQIQRALAGGHVIDITTFGRRSGQARRIETVFHNIDGRIVLSGMPGRRSWYANLLANPRMVFHLKTTVQADLPAIARPVTEPNERRALMVRVAANWGRTDLETMLARSPLVEVTFPEAPAA
jgi:Domain of unknown function (DUF385).